MSKTETNFWRRACSMGPTCEVCEARASTYKCPACSAFYCSAPCYSLHRNSHSSVSNISNDRKSSSPVYKSVLHSPRTAEKVPSDTQSVPRQKTISEFLMLNPGLRRQLRAIYEASVEQEAKHRKSTIECVGQDDRDHHSRRAELNTYNSQSMVMSPKDLIRDLRVTNLAEVRRFFEILDDDIHKCP